MRAGRSRHSGAGPPGGTPHLWQRGAAVQEARLACLLHHKVLSWAGEGSVGDRLRLPKGLGSLYLQCLHQRPHSFSGGILKMGTSSQDKPEEGEPGKRPRSWMLQNSGDSVSPPIVWEHGQDTRSPPDLGWGRCPSIYGTFWTELLKEE